jgi:hypothetical protein
MNDLPPEDQQAFMADLGKRNPGFPAGQAIYQRLVDFLPDRRRGRGRGLTIRRAFQPGGGRQDPLGHRTRFHPRRSSRTTTCANWQHCQVKEKGLSMLEGKETSSMTAKYLISV